MSLTVAASDRRIVRPGYVGRCGPGERGRHRGRQRLLRGHGAQGPLVLRAARHRRRGGPRPLRDEAVARIDVMRAAHASRLDPGGGSIEGAAALFGAGRGSRVTPVDLPGQAAATAFVTAAVEVRTRRRPLGRDAQATPQAGIRTRPAHGPPVPLRPRARDLAPRRDVRVGTQRAGTCGGGWTGRASTPRWPSPRTRRAAQGRARGHRPPHHPRGGASGQFARADRLRPTPTWSGLLLARS